jgi:predicted transposase YdaD
VAAQIDWTKGYEPLDQELQTITKGTAAKGRRLADKLMKVWQKQGQEVWVLIHLEVQSREEAQFAERMFIYHYRLFDRYQQPVVSIALLADAKASWRPKEYKSRYWGCEVSLSYHVIKLLDYLAKRAELEALQQPFAMVILAQLAILATPKDPQARYENKLALTKQLYKQGFSKDDILNLYEFIDYGFRLSEELMLKYNEDIHHIEEELHVAYITTAERIGIQKGIQQGMQQGIQQGMQQGIEKGRQDALHELASKLLADGMVVEKVAQLINLPVAVVRQITVKRQFNDL